MSVKPGVNVFTDTFAQFSARSGIFITECQIVEISAKSPPC